MTNMNASPRLVDHMMSKMDEERKELHNENESLLKRLQELSEKYQDAEQENGELKQRLAIYNEKSNDSNSPRNKNEQLAEELSRENERMQMLSQTMQKHVENLEKEKNILYKQIENLEIENENLRKIVNEAKNEINMWQNENHRVKGLVKRYEENLDDAGDMKAIVDEKENMIKKLSKDYFLAKKKLDEEISVLKEENNGWYLRFLL